MTFSVDDYLLGLSRDPYLTRIDTYTASAWIGHAPFLKFLIREQKPSAFVELGVHNGFSYFVACQAIQELQLNCKAYAVDHWKGDSQAGEFDTSVFETFSQLNSKYSAFSTVKQKTFSEAASDFSSSSIDLLHIDGFHSYESVRQDFETWLPKMKQDGIVLLHDIFVRRDTFGVYRFWRELKMSYSTLEFTNSHGLGVVFLGNKPRRLKDLFDWKSEGYLMDIQGAFGSLSDDVMHYYRLNIQSNSKIRENQVRALETELQQSKTQYELLESELLIEKQRNFLLTSSWSWKITSPYRKLRSFFNTD